VAQQGAAANPAIALWLQPTRPAGRVAELGSLAHKTRMAVPAHLTIKTDGLPFDSLLSDWRWLVSPEFTPVLMTAFGDLFLCDQSGHIHFLDLMSGQFKQVSELTGLELIDDDV
jgi:hypothetical protein